MHEWKLIGEALMKNKTLKVLDIYTNPVSVNFEFSEMFRYLCEGISQSTSLKIVSLPSMRTCQEEVKIDYAQFIKKIISPDSLFRIQVLDLVGLPLDDEEEVEAIEVIRRVCLELEKNTSIHTLALSDNGLGVSVFKLIDQLLTNNFTLQSVHRTKFSQKKIDEQSELYLLHLSVLGKLRRNKRIFLSKRIMNHFLLLKLITYNYVDTQCGCFPSDILYYVLNFVVDLQLSEFNEESYLGFISYDGGNYPFSVNDIYT